MATDATGPVTSLGIPTIDPDADAPSGLGDNSIVNAIDALLVQRPAKPAGIVSGEAMVWNGASWDRSSVTRVGPTSLGSGTPDATKVLRGDGVWASSELDYVEFTGGASSAAATEAAPLTVVTSSSITFDGSPVLFEFFSPNMQTNAAPVVGLSLWTGATDLGRIFDSGGATVANAAGTFKRRITPAAGARSYAVRLWTTAGTNFVVNAGPGGVTARMPGYLRITKVV
jgi:hypothetical protein